MHTLCTLTDFSYTHKLNGLTAPSGLSLSLGCGECLLITGESGSGKSTLLTCLAGLDSPDNFSGQCTLSCPSDWSGAPAGLVLQNPETQILCATSIEEARFGAENIFGENPEAQQRAEHSLLHTGLSPLPAEHTEALSMGQKYRLVLASVLAMHPALLLLDEPFSQLDRNGQDDLLRILAQLKSEGCGIIVCEHHLNFPTAIFDRQLSLTPKPTAKAQPVPFSRASRQPLASDTPILQLKDIHLTPERSRPLFTGLSLTLNPGDWLRISGKNGAGKSTLLSVITGQNTPDSGELELCGISAPAPWQLPGKATCMMQNPDRQLFEATVRDEILFSARAAKPKRAQAEHRQAVDRLMGKLGITELAERSPLTLSYGQKRLVTLACALIVSPSLLVLDEPATGLDPARWEQAFYCVCEELSPEAALLILTHDQDSLPFWTGQSLTLSKGQLHEHV